MAENVIDGQPTPAPAAPAPAEPTAPVAPATPAEPRGRTLSERRFFAKQDASSLPISPTEPPAQTTPPVNVVSDVVAPSPPPIVDEPAGTVPPIEPAAEPISADDFSVELPGMAVNDGVLLEGPDARHPDSPLDINAPKWQHEAYNRLQADTSISDADKKTISELPPTAWDKARRWQTDTKLLGQFRDAEVPISSVFDMLTKQSKERVAEFEVESLNRLLSNSNRMVEFSDKHGQLFAGLMTSMINEHSDVVASVLKKKGFNVVKAEPFDRNKILDEIKNHPMFETFAETDIAELVNAKINALADMVGTNEEITPEELAAGLQKADQPATDTAVRELTTSIMQAHAEVRDNQWLKAIGDGLQSSGIKPATQAELTKNPAAAHLKTVLYNAALYGLPGVITGWDEHSANWGANQTGFKETFDELASQLRAGDVARFKESSSALNPFYFEFGQKRANIAMIRNLYSTVDKILSEAAAPPPPVVDPATPPATIDGLPPAGGEPKGRTYSERRYFASRGM